eukprot:XP_015578669.1 ethylene-responsive transcription factor RAP2-11 [Ricinus communis]
MEIQFQQQKQHRRSSVPMNKTSKFKGKNRPNNNYNNKNKCLLRGSNTRTNFITHVSLDSPLASRIRNLLNNKKAGKEQQTEQEENHEVSTPSNSTVTTATSTSTSSSNMSDNNTPSREIINETQFHEDVYKPDMSNCRDEFELVSSQSDLTWAFGPGYDRFSFTQEVLDFPKDMLLSEADDLEFTEFDRMKVERNISACLYAINGVQEYMETVHDPVEALWDLPPIS